MHTSRIAIVGAGLAGLYAAFLLEQRGITDYVVLEARERVGGAYCVVLA
ncbi:NAD(P)-binding protein [Halomonas sp. 18H]|nr:NAD(P)-binding protein [Halomonas sp. 18H]MCW4150276.1 NAD(P)-binding protein [Halomonas sp. 18H]